MLVFCLCCKTLASEVGELIKVRVAIGLKVNTTSTSTQWIISSEASWGFVCSETWDGWLISHDRGVGF